MSVIAKNAMTVCLREKRIEKFPSRSVATTTVPYSPETIGRHERGEVPLGPEEVAVYAEAYKSPDLLIRYCETCAVGKELDRGVTDRDLPWATLRMNHELEKASEIRRIISDIAYDGRVDEGEAAAFEMVIRYAKSLESAIRDMILCSMTQDIKKGALAKRENAKGIC